MEPLSPQDVTMVFISTLFILLLWLFGCEEDDRKQQQRKDRQQGKNDRRFP